MNTLARIRFYIYPAIFVLVIFVMPTPDPAPMVKISAEVIAICEVAFWLGRFIQRRRRAFFIGWLSVSLIFLGSLLAATIRSEMRRWHEHVASGNYTFPSRH